MKKHRMSPSFSCHYLFPVTPALVQALQFENLFFSSLLDCYSFGRLKYVVSVVIALPLSNLYHPGSVRTFLICLFEDCPQCSYNISTVTTFGNLELCHFTS